MNKADRLHFDNVAALGCCLCFHLHGPHAPGPVELHHLRSGGWGKGDSSTVMGLCVEHHRGNLGVHGMGTKAFTRYYGISQHELLGWVKEQLS